MIYYQNNKAGITIHKKENKQARSYVLLDQNIIDENSQKVIHSNCMFMLTEQITHAHTHKTHIYIICLTYQGKISIIVVNNCH